MFIKIYYQDLTVQHCITSQKLLYNSLQYFIDNKAYGRTPERDLSHNTRVMLSQPHN